MPEIHMSLTKCLIPAHRADGLREIGEIIGTEAAGKLEASFRDIYCEFPRNGLPLAKCQKELSDYMDGHNKSSLSPARGIWYSEDLPVTIARSVIISEFEGPDSIGLWVWRKQSDRHFDIAGFERGRGL